MEPVGLLAIMKLTKQIVFKNLRHSVCIALLLAIPYAFNLITLDLPSLALDSLVRIVSVMFKFPSSKEQFLAAALNTTATPNTTSSDTLLPHLDLSPFSFIPILTSLLFSFIIPLVSTPLLTISVSRAWLNQSLNFRGSLLLSVMRAMRNLVLTSLCIGAVVFACFSCGMVVGGILLGVVLITNGNSAVAVVMFGISIALGVCVVYVAIVFSLTNTVAILEEKRGWGAMKRSMDLVNGRKWVALGLACVVYSMSLACDFSSVMWGWRGATILKVSLQALIALFSMTSHVVLYMSCKSLLEEPMALHSLPNSMDVEVLTPSVYCTPNRDASLL